MGGSLGDTRSIIIFIEQKTKGKILNILDYFLVIHYIEFAENLFFKYGKTLYIPEIGIGAQLYFFKIIHIVGLH